MSTPHPDFETLSYAELRKFQRKHPKDKNIARAIVRRLRGNLVANSFISDRNILTADNDLPFFGFR